MPRTKMKLKLCFRNSSRSGKLLELLRGGSSNEKCMESKAFQHYEQRLDIFQTGVTEFLFEPKNSVEIGQKGSYDDTIK